MENTETVVPAPDATVPELTKQEIVSAATNDPTLSPDEFTLGGRKFKVVHLAYRQYIQFISRLEPLLAALASKMTGRPVDASLGVPGLSLSSSDFSPHALLKFCADELPAMTAIVCNMEAIAAKRPDDQVTAEWVEEVAQDPFELVNIVVAQINKNSMITRFAHFFVQMLPLLRTVSGLGSTPQAK